MERIKKKLPLHKLPILVLALILVVGLASGYFIYKNQTENTKNSPPAGWVEYKNEKYRLSFIYPKTWGEPQIRETSADKGKSYSIIFNQKAAKPSDRTASIQATITSDDYEEKVCAVNDASQCASVKSFTGKDIDSRLAGDKTGLLAYDEKSYSTLVVEPVAAELKMISDLNISKKIQLDPLNSSAIRANYTIQDSGSECDKGNFTEKSGARCITKENFVELRKFLYSFRSL